MQSSWGRILIVHDRSNLVQLYSKENTSECVDVCPSEPVELRM